VSLFSLIGWRDKAEAFFTEFGLIVAAIVCVGAAIALLSIRVAPALLEKWSGLAALKRTLAYVLFGVAVGCLCWFGGYRAARGLSQEAALSAEIARQKALVAARDATAAEAARRAREIAAAQAAAALKADLIAANNRRLAQLGEYDDAASHDRDTSPCLDLGGLRRLDIGDGGRSR